VLPAHNADFVTLAKYTTPSVIEIT
jgi:hypothetical protein